MSRRARISAGNLRLVAKLNELKTQIDAAMLPMFRSGRLYCEPDNRWIAVHDDNYGASIHQWNESAATGADPLVEWEHLGEPLRAGHYIKDLDLLGQSNTTEVTDLEISVRIVRPNNPSAWLTGIDSDNEINSTEIYRGLFLNPVGGSAASGNSNDKHRRVIPLNHNVAEDSEFRIYMKPIGAITARRYFRLSYALNFSLTTLS